jgi:thiosulfate/3-mercaptopyruvate sulfurtransferase
MSLHHLLQTRLVLVVALGLVAACASSGKQPDSNEKNAPMDTLVTAEWLSQHLDDPDLVVLDCTVIVERDENGLRELSGRSNYESGHIPGAGFADLMGNLSDADAPLPFTAPSPQEFAAAMGALGVGNDSRVVLYSTENQAWAARVWWMLRWIGFDNAALLDGGLNAWTAAGQPLSSEPVMRTARTLTPRVRPALIANRDEVLAAIDNDSVNLVDALPAPFYRGEMTMYARPGHIATATNVPVTSLVDENGLYLPKDKLGELLGVERDTRTITYCGGGIAASSVAFTMVRLGFTDVAVYDGSLREWAADPANPMETSPDPEWPEE